MVETAGADVLPQNTQWLEQQIPTANAECGWKKGKQCAWGRLWSKQSTGSFWWCVGLILPRRWVRDRKRGGARQVVQEMVQSHLPSHRQGWQALACREVSEMRLLCLCWSKEVHRACQPPRYSLTYLWPGCEFFSSAAANTHWSQEQSGSSEREVILLFSYQVLHLIEPAAEKKGWP